MTSRGLESDIDVYAAAQHSVLNRLCNIDMTLRCTALELS
jgi:hypothetical protein